MSDQTTSSLRRIRTFAEDVQTARAHDASPQAIKPGETSAPAVVTMKPTGPTDTVAAIRPFADVPKQGEHIPSFHELQKKSVSNPTPLAQPITAHSTPAISKSVVTVRAKKPSTEQKNSVSSSSATIITDRNTNKVGFIGGIVQAFKNWLAAQKLASAKKKIPTYTVADVEHRKGVIQKATSKTGTIFTADRETLKEEIRRRAVVEVAKPPSHEPEITWTPNTEAGFPLLGKAATPIAPQNVQVAFKKTTVPAPTIIEPVAAVQPAVTAPRVETEEADTRWEAPPTRTVSPVPPVPTFTKEPEVFIPEPVAPEPIAVVQTPEPLATEEESLTPPVTTTTESSPRLSLGKLIPPIRSTTNRLTFGITGVIVLLVVLGVGVKILISTLFAPATMISLPPATPILTDNTVTDSVLATPTKETLVSAVQAIPASKPTELRFIDANQEPLKPTVVLGLLGFAESKNFIQTVTATRVVVNGSSRGILINVADPTTALGSLLNFEPLMVQHLATVLAISDTSTGVFIDKTIGKTDVRVTTTSDGIETLVYGFIDRDTILITKSTADFLTILGNR